MLTAAAWLVDTEADESAFAPDARQAVGQGRQGTMVKTRLLLRQPQAASFSTSTCRQQRPPTRPASQTCSGCLGWWWAGMGSWTGCALSGVVCHACTRAHDSNSPAALSRSGPAGGQDGSLTFLFQQAKLQETHDGPPTDCSVFASLSADGRLLMWDTHADQHKGRSRHKASSLPPAPCALSSQTSSRSAHLPLHFHLRAEGLSGIAGTTKESLASCACRAVKRRCLSGAQSSQ